MPLSPHEVRRSGRCRSSTPQLPRRLARADLRTQATATSRGRLPHLDVLRFAAVMLVLGRHAAISPVPSTWGHSIFDAWKRIGWTGVDLFFTLSGFLIGGLLLAELANRGTLDVRRFLLRRGLKIWPSYAVFLVVAVTAVGLPPLLDNHYWVSFARVSAFWPAFLHVQNYFRIEPRHATLDVTHLWSLSVEEHFYLVLPLLLLVLSGRRGFRQSPLGTVATVSTVVMIGCLALRTYISLWQGGYRVFTLFTPTHIRMDSLMAGVLLAAFVTYRRQAIERLRPWATLFLAVGILSFTPYLVVDLHAPLGHTVGYSVLWFGSSMMVLWAWLRSTDPAVAPASRGRALTFVALLGSYSYSIYLWHLPFARSLSNQILHVFDVNAPFTFAIYMVTFAVVSTAMGILSYRLIEGPVLAWRDRKMPQ